jgi:hypothetical protein
MAEIAWALRPARKMQFDWCGAQRLWSFAQRDSSATSPKGKQNHEHQHPDCIDRRRGPTLWRWRRLLLAQSTLVRRQVCLESPGQFAQFLERCPRAKGQDPRTRSRLRSQASLAAPNRTFLRQRTRPPWVGMAVDVPPRGRRGDSGCQRMVCKGMCRGVGERFNRGRAV